MALREKQLGQTRENSTNAVSVYSPGAGITAAIKTIVIANTGDTDATFRLFIDDNGTTYDESTSVAWDVPVPANTVAYIDNVFLMNNPSGNLPTGRPFLMP